jgi:Cu/Ag efflux pump CusA
MRWIIESSLRFRLLVIAAAAAIMAIGIVQLRAAPADVLPEFTPPYVEIQTEALGLSANEVEQLITVPLEADLLNGVSGVDTLRSESVPGMSSIVMVFRPDTDDFKARALVQERLTQAVALPNVSKPPFMLPARSSSSRVIMIGLSDGAKPLTPIEKGILARWTIRPRLLGVTGVANVAIWGQREQQLQVQVDPKRLAEKHVTLNQIIATAGNSQIVSPLTFLEASTPGTGGFVETPTQRLQVRHVFDALSTPKALGAVPIEDTNGRLDLADAATIVEDHQPLIGDAVVNGGSGLMLVVEKLPGANTLDVTRGVEAALDDLRPGLAGMKTDTNVFRPASFIESALGNLSRAILIATLLLALALTAFLLAWRSVLVSLVAFALSLLSAALVVDLFGGTMNAITLAGLALAAGLAVGDAVIGSESIVRRIRSEREQDSQASMQSIVVQATANVRGPLTYAVLIALVAVLPIAVMQGRPGAFFEPLVIAYVAAVLASTLVALTVTPALSVLLASRAPAESPVMRRLGELYAGVLARIVAAPRAAMIAAGACAVLALATLPLLDSSLVPTFKDRDLIVKLDAKPGTSQPVMTRIATAATRAVTAIPGVKDAGAHIGRAVTGDQIVDVNSSELWVNIDEGADYDETIASVKRAVDGVKGAHHEVVTYTAQKIRDVGGLNGAPAGKDGALNELTGTRKPLVVRLFGEDLAVLRTTAQDIKELVSGVPGVVNPTIEQGTVEPTIEVATKVDAARRYGIKPGDVRRTEAVLLQGIGVGSIFGKQKVFDVTVQGVPSTRKDVASVRNLLIDGERGRHVRLADVADVRVKDSPNVIKRDAVSRYLDVSAGISGRSEGAVAKDVKARLAKKALPLQYHAQVLTYSTGKEIGATTILLTAIGALIAILLLLQAAFRSWPVAVATFLTLPAALIGGLLANLLDGATLSLGAILGLIGVFAIAVRSALVLIGHLRRLSEDGSSYSREELVQHGAREQFGPIVIAALALAVFLVPFVVAGSAAGLEIVHPMATVMLGGLVTATLLSLLVAPALYARFGGDYDAADDLLLDLGDAPGAPAAADGRESWITVNPDVIESTPKADKPGQPRRRAVVDGASDVPSDPGEGAS